MQFSGEIWPNNRLAQPSLDLVAPSGKSWIRHLFLSWTKLKQHKQTQECVPVGCVPSAAVAVCLGGGGVSACGVYTSPRTEFLTHACENITFPQLRLRTVITRWVKRTLLFAQVLKAQPIAQHENLVCFITTDRLNVLAPVWWVKFTNKIKRGSVKLVWRRKVTCCGNERKEPVWVLSPQGGSKCYSILWEGCISLTSTVQEKKLQFSNDNGAPFRHVRIPSKITIGGSRGARPIKIFPLFIQFWKIDK